MTPYYSEDGITIYHGDCREWSGSADVLITDPPYGVGFDGKATKHTEGGSGGYTTDDDSEVGPAVVKALLPLVQRAAVFPGNRNLFRYPEPRDIGCVYCPSGAGIGPWGFTCFHPVLFYGTRRGTLQPSSIHSFDTADQCGHPCPKPMRWLHWLVGLTSQEGETIIDPFMGSGTTIRAAKDLGRRAIGVEIEERYCEMAVDRLAQGVLAFPAYPSMKVSYEPFADQVGEPG